MSGAADSPPPTTNYSSPGLEAPLACLRPAFCLQNSTVHMVFHEMMFMGTIACVPISFTIPYSIYRSVDAAVTGQHPLFITHVSRWL